MLVNIVESEYETFLVRVFALPITRQARKKLEADLTKLKQLVEEESLAGLTRHRTPSSYSNIIRA